MRVEDFQLLLRARGGRCCERGQRGDDDARDETRSRHRSSPDLPAGESR
jgi:hypothetical protein